MIEQSSLDKTLIPQPTTPRKAQTIHKRTERASSQPITTTLLQRLHTIIDNHSNHLLLLPTTLQLLKIRSRSERHSPRSTVPTGLLSLDHSRVWQRRSPVVEAQRGEDGGHVVVVAEISVESAIQWEGCGVGVEGAVDGGFVVDGLAGEAGDELVGEADALGRAEGVAVAVAVVFVQGLEGF